jgi:hypothetical protein
MSKDIIFMQCGHTANATTKNDDGNEIPCCVLCCSRNDLASKTVVTPPDITGRKARCSYCYLTVNSDFDLAFFECRPDHEFDCYYCGCRGWD